MATIRVEHLEAKVNELVNLPTLPSILKKISLMTESKETSASDVAEAISTDQVLTAKVLRLVNSPVYGFPGRISSITHAVVLLGFNTVKGLVLGTAVFNSMGTHGHGLWEHSLGCAILTRRLAKEMGLADIEEIMIAGLLHDLGKVVLAYLYPTQYSEAVDNAKANRTHIAVEEKKVFGIDHTRPNRWLAEQWHLPDRLSEPLIYHHVPGAAKNHAPVVAVVHVADHLARCMGFGFPGDVTMPALDHDAYHLVNFSFEQLDHILQDAELEFAAGVDVFQTGDNK